MLHQIGHSDIVFLLSLGYTCVDLVLEWDDFSSCRGPIHKWLFASCLCAIGFRLTRLLGSLGCSEGTTTEAAGRRPIGGQLGEYLLDIGHKGWLPRAVVLFTWTALAPFFVVWNLLGSVWLWQVLQETPHCAPTSTHLWFSAGWLLLTYLWLIVHAILAIKAQKLRRRAQRAEAQLLEVEDAETVERWGHVSRAAGSRNLMDTECSGLCPAAIKALPSEIAAPSDGLEADQRECSICLMDVSPGECVRCLPKCGHVFHRSCIDLWLVRQAECPLCKQKVEDDA